MKNIFKYTAIAAALSFAGFSPQAAHADSPAVYTSWQDNVAVGGYDVVSFYSGTPLAGTSDHVVDYKGAAWQFSTEANLDLFKTNPDAFIPQYGGYCAWAVANNKLAKGSPEHWHIEDGKLYLNFNKRIAKRWNKKIPKFVDKADTNWPEILVD